MKTFAVLSVFAATVLAQSSNPLIPTGISQGCTDFLVNFNNNTNLTSCTSPIISATTAFGPGATSSKPSSSNVTSALTSLCSTTAFSNCPDSTIRTQLGGFSSACSAELTNNPNKDVLRIYDTLYTLIPLRQAICSKDTSGSYCVTQVANGLQSTGTVDVAVGGSGNQAKLDNQNLYYALPNTDARRDDSSTAALIPNVTTFRNSNIVFLFLQPTMATSSLCVSCTRSILTPYITFESSLPYAPGLPNSPLMGGQMDLITAIFNGCGKSFLSGVAQAAGGISSGILSGSGHRSVSHDLTGAVSVFLGLAAVAVASI